jgi:hypothetical protein
MKRSFQPGYTRIHYDKTPTPLDKLQAALDDALFQTRLIPSLSFTWGVSHTYLYIHAKDRFTSNASIRGEHPPNAGTFYVILAAPDFEQHMISPVGTYHYQTLEQAVKLITDHLILETI